MGEFSYAYDELNRLTEVNHPNFGITEYTYDTLGNMVKEAGSGGEIDYSYNEFNQLTQRADNRSTTDYTWECLMVLPKRFSVRAIPSPY